MKKTIEYLKDLFEEPFQLDDDSIDSEFFDAIRQAQTDAIDATVKRFILDIDAIGGVEDLTARVLGMAEKMKSEL